MHCVLASICSKYAQTLYITALTHKSVPWLYRLLGDAQCSLVQGPNFRLVLEKVTQQVNCKAVLKFHSCGLEKQSPSSLLLMPIYFFSALVEELEMFGKIQTGHPSFFKAFLFFIGPFKSN